MARLQAFQRAAEAAAARRGRMASAVMAQVIPLLLPAAAAAVMAAALMELRAARAVITLAEQAAALLAAGQEQTAAAAAVVLWQRLVTKAALEAPAPNLMLREDPAVDRVDQAQVTQRLERRELASLMAQVPPAQAELHLAPRQARQAVKALLS